MKYFLSILEKIPVWGVLIISVAFVIIGDYFGKQWSVERKHWLFVIAIGCSLLSGVFYFPTLLRSPLVLSSLMWSLLSIIGFLGIGLLVFHERLSGMQVVGVGLGIVALILLNLK